MDMSGRIPEQAKKMEREGERERDGYGWYAQLLASHAQTTLQFLCNCTVPFGVNLAFGMPKEGSVSFLVAQQCLCKCSGGSCILSWGKRQVRRGVKCVGRLVDFGGGLLAACSVNAYDCPFSRHL